MRGHRPDVSGYSQSTAAISDDNLNSELPPFRGRPGQTGWGSHLSNRCHMILMYTGAASNLAATAKSIKGRATRSCDKYAFSSQVPELMVSKVFLSETELLLIIQSSALPCWGDTLQYLQCCCLEPWVVWARALSPTGEHVRAMSCPRWGNLTHLLPDHLLWIQPSNALWSTKPWRTYRKTLICFHNRTHATTDYIVKVLSNNKKICYEFGDSI